jgi:hypothetical protein
MQVPAIRFRMLMLAVATAAALFAVAGASAETQLRNPLRIDVPSRPRLPNTTEPVLFTCVNLDDCQAQAKQMCEGFHYPNGKILFRDIAPAPRPFPIYSVICFD